MLEESGSLFIDKADVSDTARFLCVVENPAGVVTREITLTVHGKLWSSRMSRDNLTPSIIEVMVISSKSFETFYDGLILLNCRAAKNIRRCPTKYYYH